MGEGFRVERSGTRHYNQAGTPSDRQPVTFLSEAIAENPKPYTAPRVMHPRLLPAPGIPQAGFPQFALARIDTHSEFRLRNSIPALARESGGASAEPLLMQRVSAA
ncbi:hypothetical protein GCM10010303_86110 [Streptomyces purpurascens]|nr:hypothetical protein GCM10010303_86110 [Streptomyces purpurascens]